MEIALSDHETSAIAAPERRGRRPADRTRGRTTTTFAAACVLLGALVVAGAMTRPAEPATPTTTEATAVGVGERLSCTEHLALSAAAVGVDPLFWTYGVLNAVTRAHGTLDEEILRRLRAVQTLTPPTRDNLASVDAVDAAIAEIERRPCRIALNST